MNDNCDFCLNSVHKQQAIIENESARLLYPLRPLIWGHFMIISKRHVALFTDLTDEELISVKDLISKVKNTLKINKMVDGYNILNNNNKIGGQHIPHAHFHVFMRKKGEVSPFDILAGKDNKESLGGKEWEHRIKKIRRLIRKQL